MTQQQIITKAYWRNLVIQCAVIFTVGLIITGVVLYYYIYQPSGSSYSDSFKILSQLRQDILYKAVIIYTATLVLILFGIGIITLLYSHRVAGPIYRLSTIAKKVADGDLQQVARLRQKDVTQSLASELNSLMENYKKTVEELEKKIGDLKQVSSNTNWSTITKESDQTVSDLKKATGEIGKLMKNIRL